EIDRAVAQRRIAFVDRKNQLEQDVEPLLFEEPQLDRRCGGKIRVRDQVGHGELHDRVFPFTRMIYLLPIASRMPAAVAIRSASRRANPSACNPSGRPSSSSSGS